MNHRFTMAVLAALLSGCGTDPVTESADSSTAAAAVKDAPPVELGLSGNASDMEVTVNSVEQKNLIGPKGFGDEAGPGEIFVVVRYAVKNLGKKPLMRPDFPGVELIDGADQGYAEDRQAAVLEAALNDDLQSSGDVNPNVSAKLTSVWKVDRASFDPAVWRLKVSFDQGFSATMDKAAKWPLDSDAAPPVLFKLK